MTKSVLISYSRDDREKVESLAEDIRKLGHEVWIDQSLIGGQDWWDEILDHIRICDVFVFVLSGTSLDSIACQREYGYADRLGKPILPIAAEQGLDVGSLPAPLARIQYVEYHRRNAEVLNDLASAVAALPTAADLPDPLPAPPDVPLPLATKVRQQIESPSPLTFEEQSTLLVQLKRCLREGEQVDLLLDRFFDRGDLAYAIGTEIRELQDASSRAAGGDATTLQEVLTSKNIVVCIDAFDLEFSFRPTNMMLAIQQIKQSGEQVVYYDTGVVDDAGPFRTLRRVSRPFALRYSANRQLADAYAFLIDHYRAGDRVFLVGSSRGGGVARILADLLVKCGLLQQGLEKLIPWVIEVYHGEHNDSGCEQIRSSFSRLCTPHFVGLWDAVDPARLFMNPRSKPHAVPKGVRYAVQAMAIDERRSGFFARPWIEDPGASDQTVEQAWFAGVHSDVIGGYAERGLADVPYRWLLEKAAAAGLILRKGWERDLSPNPTGADELHDSYRNFWRLFPPRHREIQPGAPVHHSVVERLEAGVGYAPRNLPGDYEVV